MEEIGVVIKTDGITAKVVVQKKGACDGCAGKGACKSTDDGMEIDALNNVNAQLGQTVRVSLGAYTYLKSSMIAYAMPLAFFIAGAILGKNAGVKYFTNLNSDLVAAIAGFAALAISILFIKMFSSRAESKEEYRPYIEEIVDP